MMTDVEELPKEHESQWVDLRRDPVVFMNNRIDIEHPGGLNRAPTRDAGILLNSEINRPHMDFSRRFAQTPLGPEKLLTHTRPYPKVLMSVAHARLGEIFATTGLDDPQFGRYTSAIQEEVVTEYMRRLAGNTAAYESLKQEVLGDDTPSIYSPTMVDRRVANLIWKARTGSASVRDTAELLLRFPRMRAIEAAKYTQPLDHLAPLVVQAHIDAGLQMCARNSRFDLEIYDDSENGRAKTHDRRIDVLSSLAKNDVKDDEEIEALRRSLGITVDVNHYAAEETAKAMEEAQRRRAHIFATKSNRAEVSDGTTLIQLVCKQSWIILPLNAGIDYSREGAIKKRRVTLPGMSDAVDLQPISTSYYWRTLPVSHK